MGIFGKPEPNKPETSAPYAGTPSPTPVASSAPRSGSPCVIGSKTVIKGVVTGDEDVIVEGTIEGEVHISRELRIGPGGTVKATIEAQSIIVSGEVIGDCQAVARVEIQASGKLTGNIRAPKIMIAEGAMFRGNSDMSGRKEERKDKPAAS
jgi:cytoskeletal protein CcmA (bactofilin family)